MIRIALLKNAKGLPECTLIEGMACSGGCINGGGCVSHSSKNAADVDAYGKKAMEKSVLDSIKNFQ